MNLAAKAILTIGIASAQSFPVPAVDVIYPAPSGTIFDAGCGALLKTTVAPEVIQQAVRRAPEFQAIWEREGPAYLSTTFAEIGLPYPYKEVQASLTVCTGVISMSSPLFVNVVKFLPSAPRRYPDSHFVEILYHELMHTYVRKVRDVSALRKKYADESPVCLSHLHVMALEKLVLVKLGKTEDLKLLASEYQNSLSAPYKRAWTIVNDIEGHEVFIQELKQLASPNQR